MPPSKPGTANRLRQRPGRGLPKPLLNSTLSPPVLRTFINGPQPLAGPELAAKLEAVAQLLRSTVDGSMEANMVMVYFGVREVFAWLGAPAQTLACKLSDSACIKGLVRSHMQSEMIQTNIVSYLILYSNIIFGRSHCAVAWIASAHCMRTTTHVDPQVTYGTQTDAECHVCHRCWVRWRPVARSPRLVRSSRAAATARSIWQTLPLQWLGSCQTCQSQLPPPRCKTSARACAA